jgi:hypothetical protein
MDIQQGIIEVIEHLAAGRADAAEVAEQQLHEALREQGHDYASYESRCTVRAVRVAQSAIEASTVAAAEATERLRRELNEEGRQLDEAVARWSMERLRTDAMRSCLAGMGYHLDETGSITYEATRPTTALAQHLSRELHVAA